LKHDAIYAMPLDRTVEFALLQEPKGIRKDLLVCVFRRRTPITKLEHKKPWPFAWDISIRS
jgi:hypothetical protein